MSNVWKGFEERIDQNWNLAQFRVPRDWDQSKQHGTIEHPSAFSCDLRAPGVISFWTEKSECVTSLLHSYTNCISLRDDHGSSVHEAQWEALPSRRRWIVGQRVHSDSAAFVICSVLQLKLKAHLHTGLKVRAPFYSNERALDFWPSIHYYLWTGHCYVLLLLEYRSNFHLSSQNMLPLSLN